MFLGDAKVKLFRPFEDQGLPGKQFCLSPRKGLHALINYLIRTIFKWLRLKQ